SALPQSSRQPGDVFDRCLLVEPHGHPVDFEHQPITSLWPGLDHPHGYQRSTRRGAGARATLRPQFVDPVRQGRPSHAQFLRALRARLATRLRLLDGPFPELSASLFALHGPQHAQVEIGFARRPWSDGYTTNDDAAQYVIDVLRAEDESSGLQESLLYYGYPRYRDEEDSLVSSQVLVASPQHGIIILGTLNESARDTEALMS